MMRTTSSDTNIEPLWRTYLQAMASALPAAIAWGFACLHLVPKLREICYMARLEPTQLGWLWKVPWFLVGGGQSIWIAAIFILAFSSLFGRGWARHRRVTVSIVVWMLNVFVLFGLTVLLRLALIAAASPASPK